MRDSISKAGPNPIGAPMLSALLGRFGRPKCDPDVSRKDLQAIRRLVRSLPLISGPILSVSRAEDDQRPNGCEAAEVFAVMTGTRPAPLSGRGECLIVVKQNDGQMTLAERQHWVS
jgi:hypothetical protein